MVRMMVFIVLVGILAAVLFPTIREAFQHNVGLNGMIVALLLIGVIYSFRMVWRLFPEVNWVNHFRIADPGSKFPIRPACSRRWRRCSGTARGRPCCRR